MFTRLISRLVGRWLALAAAVLLVTPAHAVPEAQFQPAFAQFMQAKRRTQEKIGFVHRFHTQKFGGFSGVLPF